MTIETAVSLDDIAQDYGNLVSSVCRRMIRDEESAKEAAQQVWLAIVKSWPSFRGDSKISTWIYTITRRVAMNHAKRERLFSARHLRTYAEEKEFELPDNTDIEKTLWIKEMCNKCLTGMLHCFDYDARIALVFRDITELPYEDIADIMEKDATALRQEISRNRRKLKSFLTDHCTLFNPTGNCRCRMKRLVREIDLAKEYEKIRETVLPKKNYWKNIL